MGTGKICPYGPTKERVCPPGPIKVGAVEWVGGEGEIECRGAAKLPGPHGVPCAGKVKWRGKVAVEAEGSVNPPAPPGTACAGGGGRGLPLSGEDASPFPKLCAVNF
jgi:hypothetical protein